MQLKDIHYTLDLDLQIEKLCNYVVVIAQGEDGSQNLIWGWVRGEIEAK